MTDYLEAAACMQTPPISVGFSIDINDLPKHGAFPPTDPRSRSGAALLSIARKLKDEGGSACLAEVLDAYRGKYGDKRAATLNVRWHHLAEQ